MRQVSLSQLMTTSGVGFGTSGARGLAEAMSDEVCYTYTQAFIQHLEQAQGLKKGSKIALAGDLRPSTPRIMAAIGQAISDCGYSTLNGGYVPTPAISVAGLAQNIPSIMVTGSHIPDDRNGIKFNKIGGEILKDDEAGIRAQTVGLADIFDDAGMLKSPFPLPEVDSQVYENYIQRYCGFLPEKCLQDTRIGLYEHSSVARDILSDLFKQLGAEVLSLGRSELFIPVDTEAVRPEDVVLAKQWASEHRFDAIVSTDGDGDRPLVGDENGHWLRGDVAGILTAHWLEAEAVVTPVSSNSALEKSGLFKKVARTRIGSPFVIAAMNQLVDEGMKNVIGYEANGGFLTANTIERDGKHLAALPTRDAAIVALAIILAAKEKGCSVSELVKTLPPRFTSSDRLKAFPTELSQQRIGAFNSGDMEKDKANIEASFGHLCGKVIDMDDTDGLRITFENQEVIHLRPSGNAPELRCYNEADTEARAEELNKACLEIMSAWRE